MKDLRGSELNAVALTDEDFENIVMIPKYKVFVYRNGWKEVDGVANLTVDFQGSEADGVLALFKFNNAMKRLNIILYLGLNIQTTFLFT